MVSLVNRVYLELEKLLNKFFIRDLIFTHPLLPETVDKVKCFLELISSHVDTPEVFVEPGGEILMEWKKEYECKIVVFMNNTGRISYSIEKYDTDKKI